MKYYINLIFFIFWDKFCYSFWNDLPIWFCCNNDQGGFKVFNGFQTENIPINIYINSLNIIKQIMKKNLIHSKILQKKSVLKTFHSKFLCLARAVFKLTILSYSLKTSIGSNP